MIRQDPSVSKSNRVHVVIFRIFSINSRYILPIPLQWLILFLRSSTSTGYFSTKCYHGWLVTYVVWCGPKNGHQEAMWLKEIGLWAPKFDSHCRVTSQHNWETYITSMRIFTLIMNKIFMNMSSKIMRKVAWVRYGYAHHLVLIACFTFYKTWARQ